MMLYLIIQGNRKEQVKWYLKKRVVIELIECINLVIVKKLELVNIILIDKKRYLVIMMNMLFKLKGMKKYI
jgi:hypothetical protein